MMGDPRTINACAHLLFIAKNLERIGDHATNIAEIMHYEITGEELCRDVPNGTPCNGPSSQIGNRRVTPYMLVVEDEDALATLLQYNLDKEGYEVALAPDGEEALMLVDERLPDLVVLDWMLPKVSGIEVCRRLRARRRRATCRSSCSPPAARRPTGSAAWTPGPTTISSSRSP